MRKGQDGLSVGVADYDSIGAVVLELMYVSKISLTHASTQMRWWHVSGILTNETRELMRIIPAI